MVSIFDTKERAADVAMSQIECCNCAIVFWAPANWVQHRRDKHNDFYCPNGHVLAFNGKSEAEKLRDQLAREKHITEQAQARAMELHQRLKDEERRSAAARGQVTKIKNSVKHGVCPCCNRTFKQLAAHMKTKHPDYVAGEDR